MDNAFFYNRYKLSHNGMTVFKQFEGYNRKIKKNSLSNLLSNKDNLTDILEDYKSMYLEDKDKDRRAKIIETVKSICEISEANKFMLSIKEDRNLSISQSKKVKRYAGKLCYYSATRKFESKKSGKFYMKVAFLTLTVPEGTLPSQSLKAFNHFLDYLRRTANCVYVWKKELGEKNNNLHYHILINNFLPYYIVSWKWKRLLLQEGVIWPNNSEGKPTTSHYRIELPKNKKLVAHYISKYMSKAHELPKEYGYIWGKSAVLQDCKELIIDEGEGYEEEFKTIEDNYRTIGDKYVKHSCIDLLSLKDICPKIFAVFIKQYHDFQNRITLSQRFQTI
jgi:hypothetical protein